MGLLIRLQLPHPLRGNYKRYGSLREIDFPIFLHRICYGGLCILMCKVGAKVHEFCCLHLFGVGCRPEARGSSVVWANFEFRQKVFVSTKVGVTTFPSGGKISEMTS